MIRCLAFALALCMILLPAAAEETPRAPLHENELSEEQAWFVEDHAAFDPAWELFERVPMPDHPWFWVYKMPEDVYALFEPYQEELVISYLIIGEESALLWDTGLGIGNIRDCVDELTSLPVTVLNSHGDFDHIGGNALFDRVMCYHIDSVIEALTDGVTHEELMVWVDPDAIVNPPEDFSPDTFFVAGKAPTATVEDGQIIDLGGRQLEVVYTPGHTEASIMLIDEQHGLLFTGDTWYPGPLFALMDDSSLPDYVESMGRAERIIRDRNIQWIYGSHNEVLPGTELFFETVDFLEDVLRGEISYEVEDGLREYIMDDLMSLYTLEEEP